MSQQQKRAARMRSTIEHAFATARVSVLDQSAQHVGHAGAADAGETHYDVSVVSEAFTGMSRIARSRAVHDTLAAEFAAGLHALSLTLLTPEEEGNGKLR